MNDRPSIEVTADTIDEAVAEGLNQLGVGPGDVIVEVVEEPSRGVFGIGARPAKVRLQLLRRPAPPQEQPPAGRTGEPRRTDTPRESRRRGSARTRPSDSRAQDKPVRQSTMQDEYDYNEEEEAFAFSDVQGDASGEDGDVSREVLQELLRHMEIKAEVKVMRAAASQPGENPPWLLNVEGRDISSLIGRRGETLTSLQYITRLIASRRLGRRANIVVDAGGYKSRRSQKLRELAIRMADQAVREARTVILEPMPPHERRMIHMALRNRSDVFTKSTGEGDSRKVTIVPK